MKYLVIDISTSAQEDIEDSPYLSWACKKGASSPEEAYSKAGLHAEYGMVCCISAYWVKFTADCNYTSEEAFTMSAYDKDTEEHLLMKLQDVLFEFNPPLRLSDDRGEQPEFVKFVGHNMKNFVIPFLVKRYLGNGLKVPMPLSSMMVTGNYVDLMHTLACGGESMMSLRSAAWLFGIDDPRSSVRSPKFYELVKDGNMKDVEKYTRMNAKVAADVFANCVLGGLIETEETWNFRN